MVQLLRVPIPIQFLAILFCLFIDNKEYIPAFRTLLFCPAFVNRLRGCFLLNLSCCFFGKDYIMTTQEHIIVLTGYGVFSILNVISWTLYFSLRDKLSDINKKGNSLPAETKQDGRE